MPLVKICYNQTTIPVDTLKKVTPQIRETIADALDCADEGGDLTPDDMEVVFYRYGDYDESDFDVLVDIEAMSFPLREASKRARANEIFRALRDLLADHLNIAVWLKLVNAAWVSG